MQLYLKNPKYRQTILSYSYMLDNNPQSTSKDFNIDITMSQARPLFTEVSHPWACRWRSRSGCASLTFVAVVWKSKISTLWKQTRNQGTTVHLCLWTCTNCPCCSDLLGSRMSWAIELHLAHQVGHTLFYFYICFILYTCRHHAPIGTNVGDTFVVAPTTIPYFHLVLSIVLLAFWAALAQLHFDPLLT